MGDQNEQDSGQSVWPVSVAGDTDKDEVDDLDPAKTEGTNQMMIRMTTTKLNKK